MEIRSMISPFAVRSHAKKKTHNIKINCTRRERTLFILGEDYRKTVKQIGVVLISFAIGYGVHTIILEFKSKKKPNYDTQSKNADKFIFNSGCLSCHPNVGHKRKLI